MFLFFGLICFAAYTVTIKLGWRYFLVSLLFLGVISAFDTVALRGADGPAVFGGIIFAGTILQTLIIAHGIKWLYLLIKYSLKFPAFVREVWVNAERVDCASFLAIKNGFANLLKEEFNIMLHA